jgi:TRIAP1/MDM35 family protein
VSTSTTLSNRMEYSRQKALEFEEKCGKVWESYQGCVQVRVILCSYSVGPHNIVKEAVKEKGLDGLLQQARNENPLTDPPSAAQP